jgi:hypothetical protein
MAGWGNVQDDEQDDGLTSSLVYGSKSDGTEAQSATQATALPGPQPSQGDYSTGEGKGVSQRTQPGDQPTPPNQPTPPTYSPSPLPSLPNQHLDQYQQYEQTLQKPAPSLNDPQYKPHWYERLAGGLTGAMVGYKNPELGVKVGTGVTDRRFDTATQDYQNQQNTARQGMQDYRTQQQDAGQQFEKQLQLHNANESDYNTQERAYQGQVTANDRQAQEKDRLAKYNEEDAQPDDPKNLLGGWHVTNAGGQTVRLPGPPKGREADPNVIAARRTADVQRLNLKGDDAKFYQANGKLREPAPNVNIKQEPAGTQEWNAYTKSLGHEPNTQEVLNFKRNQTGGSGKLSDSASRLIIQKKNDDMAKAQRAYHRAMADAATDADKQSAEDDFLDDAETAQRAYEEQINQKTGQEVEPFDIRGALKASLHGGGQPQQTPPQQAPQQPQAQPAAPSQPKAAPAPQAAPQAAPGATVKVVGADGRQWTIPQANLAAALKRGAKQVQ